MNATLRQSASPSEASARPSRSVIAGRVITGLALAFMVMDVTMKLASVKQAVESTVELGFSPDIVLPLGLIQLSCLILYMIPRTAPLGATLLTGYLGGAVAIHVQRGNPVLTHMLFPVYIAVLLWGGLHLRDARVRALFAQID
jgi:DoxX-like family